VALGFWIENGSVVESDEDAGNLAPARDIAVPRHERYGSEEIDQIFGLDGRGDSTRHRPGARRRSTRRVLDRHLEHAFSSDERNDLATAASERCERAGGGDGEIAR